MLAEKVFNVQRFSDRIILIRLIIGKGVYTFISVYAPQSGLTEADKQSFYDMLQSVVAMIPSSEIVFPLGDRNGYVGLECNWFEGVHGGHGFGTRNVEGKKVLEFVLANDLVVGNTCFIKRESHLVSFNSGTNRTQIDYILYRKSFRKAVKDVKVIPDEECVQQHNLVVCYFSVLIPRPKKRKFTPRIRSWKLQDQTVAKEFKGVFTEKAAATQPYNPTKTVEDVWAG